MCVLLVVIVTNMEARGVSSILGNHLPKLQKIGMLSVWALHALVGANVQR